MSTGRTLMRQILCLRRRPITSARRSSLPSTRSVSLGTRMARRRRRVLQLCKRASGVGGDKVSHPRLPTPPLSLGDRHECTHNPPFVMDHFKTTTTSLLVMGGHYPVCLLSSLMLKRQFVPPLTIKNLGTGK